MPQFQLGRLGRLGRRHARTGATADPSAGGGPGRGGRFGSIFQTSRVVSSPVRVTDDVISNQRHWSLAWKSCLRTCHPQRTVDHSNSSTAIVAPAGILPSSEVALFRPDNSGIAFGRMASFGVAQQLLGKRREVDREVDIAQPTRSWRFRGDHTPHRILRRLDKHDVPTICELLHHNMIQSIARVLRFTYCPR